MAIAREPEEKGHASRPLRLQRCSASGEENMIASEIVIVDDDGTEEPFDAAMWFK